MFGNLVSTYYGAIAMVTAHHGGRLNRLIMQFVIKRNREVEGGRGRGGRGGRRGGGGLGLVHIAAILVLGAFRFTTQLV